MMKRTSTSFLTGFRRGLALVLVGLALAAPAQAQDAGQVRVQTRPLEDAPPPVAPPVEAIRDYREEMRQFIQSLATFARRQKRDFVIIVQNALDLLTKAEDGDVLKQAPARTYMRAINGVLVEGISYGRKRFGAATPPERQKKMLALIDQAKRARLKVLAVDYTADRAAVDKAYTFDGKKGFIPFVANAKGQDLNAIPSYPRLPYKENPKSILSMGAVKNFAWIQDSSAFGLEAEYALAMHKNNFDALITGVFHGLNPLSRKAVETLKYKHLGARRLVLAHINIGAAASYQYYWKAHWQEGSPRWINAPVAGNPDQYYVEYWQPEWQKIVTGDAMSYIYGVIRQGYDGVVLDGAEAYRFWEGTLREDEDDQFLAE